jgi:3-hydroxyacyl-[acyl-carrier-protein] dehydratase
MPIDAARTEEINKALKRCSDETIAAALRLQEGADDTDLDVIIRGVLARDLQEERLPDLPKATDDSRLIEDVGMDSFGMIEVVMTAEEVLGITISNEEMKGIKTLGELKSFLRAKLVGRIPGNPA